MPPSIQHRQGAGSIHRTRLGWRCSPIRSQFHIPSIRQCQGRSFHRRDDEWTDTKHWDRHRRFAEFRFHGGRPKSRNSWGNLSTKLTCINLPNRQSAHDEFPAFSNAITAQRQQSSWRSRSPWRVRIRHGGPAVAQQQIRSCYHFSLF